MWFGRRFLTFMALPTHNRDLILSQASAFRRHVPLMYAMVLINVGFLSYTHFSTAPAVLTLYLPAVLALASLLRILSWRRGRKTAMGFAEASRMLVGTLWLSVGLGLCFVLWALLLLPYGDLHSQAQVAFFISITTISCALCLMHVRAAAILLSVTVFVPFLAVFLTSGEPVFVAISLNAALVMAVLIIIMLRYSADFAELVVSKRALVDKQRETQRLGDESQRLANIDSLTGLPNRRQFLSRLDTFEADDGVRIGVGCIDLDGFKAVNDVFGHKIGDLVLTAAGDRMKRAIGPAGMVARVGGDEFGFIVGGIDGQAGLAKELDALCLALRQPFFFPGVTVKLSASVGLALSGGQHGAIEGLYEKAEHAAFIAKDVAKGSWIRFSDRHDAELLARSRIEQALAIADFDAEIALAYQPLYELSTDRPSGYEILARWTSPTLGPVPPDVFIPAAERMGIVSAITHAVIRKALNSSLPLPADNRLSINLSASDICSTESMDVIYALVLTRAPGAPQVDFEVTETALMSDIATARASLSALRDLGCKVSLDDFGTGNASLTYVQKLPLDRIKIDRSFVAEMENDTVSATIVKTTVALCKGLKLACVLEGVETQSQFDMGRRLGATHIQGYFTGRPMSEAQVHDTLLRRSA